MNIYAENGYSSREEYLNLLRLDYGQELVDRLIEKFPPSEDFGQLIMALEEFDQDDSEYGVWDDEDWVIAEDD